MASFWSTVTFSPSVHPSSLKMNGFNKTYKWCLYWCEYTSLHSGSKYSSLYKQTSQFCTFSFKSYSPVQAALGGLKVVLNSVSITISSLEVWNMNGHFSLNRNVRPRRRWAFFLLGGPPLMTGDGPKMVHFGPKMAKHTRLVNVPKWSKRVQKGPKWSN